MPSIPQNWYESVEFAALVDQLAVGRHSGVTQLGAHPRLAFSETGDR
jgi:hypothetical protein